jgi:hypothetical protein
MMYVRESGPPVINPEPKGPTLILLFTQSVTFKLRAFFSVSPKLQKPQLYNLKCAKWHGTISLDG